MSDAVAPSPIEYISHQREEAFELMFGAEDSIVGLLQRSHTPGLSMRAEEKPIVEHALEEADRVLSSSANTVFYWIDIEDERSVAIINAAKSIISKWCRSELKLTGKSEIADNVGNVAVELACQLQSALGTEKIKNGVYPKHRQALIDYYGPDFTIDFLDGTMIEDTLGISTDESKTIMSQGTRNKLAANYPRNALRMAERVKENFDTLETDRITQALGWEVEEVEAIMTPGMRRQLAQDPQTEALELLEKIRDNIELLTTENIARATGWDESRVEEVFTAGLRKSLAIRKRSDPLQAATMVAANLDGPLSDNGIAELLGWTKDEARLIFTPAFKKKLAYSYIHDPAVAIKRIKDNLELLTDQTISETIGWTEAQVREMFGSGTKRRIAIDNISNPLGKLQQIKKDFNRWKKQYPDLPEKIIFEIANRSSKEGSATLRWLNDTTQSLPPNKYIPRNLLIWQLYKCKNKDDPVAEAIRCTQEQVLVLQVLHSRSTESFSGDFSLLKIVADPKSTEPLDQIVDQEEQAEYRLMLEKLTRRAEIDPGVIDEMLGMEDPSSHPAFKKLQDAASHAESQQT